MVERAEATRWRVLLVDGDGDVREQLRSAWVRGPLDLHHADDVATAARLHQAVPFDALLLNTDQVAGPCLSWCRTLRAAGDDTPLVMLSGHATEIDRILGLEAGADDFVSKPVHPQELQARLQAIVRRGLACEPPGCAGLTPAWGVGGRPRPSKVHPDGLGRGLCVHSRWCAGSCINRHTARASIALPSPTGPMRSAVLALMLTA